MTHHVVKQAGARLPYAFLILVIAAQIGWCVLAARLFFCEAPAMAFGRISLAHGDHHSYVGAMEHYITHDEYSFINSRGDNILAGRLPHYSLPYLLFRQLMGPGAAADLLVILQTALVGLAAWMLGGVLMAISGRMWLGKSLVVIVALSPHLANYLCLLQPDAAGLALLTIGCCLVWLSLRRPSRGNLWRIAVVAAVLVSIKPYFALLIPIALLVWLFHRVSLRRVAQRALILLVPALILLVPWWVRNARHFGHFFPFQQDLYAGWGYQEPELRMRSFIALLGGDATTWWEPGALSCLMVKDPPLPCTASWPAYLSPSLRARIDRLQATYFALQEGKVSDAHAIAAIDSVSAAYRHAHPFRAAVLNPLHRVKLQLVYSGSNLLPFHGANPCYRPWMLMAKLMASAAYAASLLGLVLAALLAVTGRLRNHWGWLLPPLYLIVFFPLLFGSVEWRYFISVYLIDLFLLLLLFGMWLDRRDRKRNQERRGSPQAPLADQA